MTLNVRIPIDDAVKLLETMEFSDVMKIIDLFGFGGILTRLTKIQSRTEVDAVALSRCIHASLTHIILPHCKSLTDDILALCPSLISLTVAAGSHLTAEAFRPLTRLTELQILSRNSEEPDTLLNNETIAHMPQLEMLHVRNSTICDEHLRHLPNLKVLVLYGNDMVTPDILNHLPKLEICVLNRRLYKYLPSEKNKAIMIRWA